MPCCAVRELCSNTSGTVYNKLCLITTIGPSHLRYVFQTILKQNSSKSINRMSACHLCHLLCVASDPRRTMPAARPGGQPGHGAGGTVPGVPRWKIESVGPSSSFQSHADTNLNSFFEHGKFYVLCKVVDYYKLAPGTRKVELFVLPYRNGF